MFESIKSMSGPFLIVAVLFVVIEMLAAAKGGKSVYKQRDTLCNLAILLVGRLSMPLFAGYIYYTVKFFEPYHIFAIPQNIGTTILAVVVTDLVYYLEHRASHKLALLWFFHEVHHSSRNFNYTTSFRLHWLGRLTAPILFAPLVVLGFKSEQVVVFFIANLFYQFFLHTRMVGKLGILEGVFNTPSAHRVHHGRNQVYIDKNFGGILMIWDRLFGTYQSEIEEVEYGVLGDFESNNPLVVQFHNLPGYVLFKRLVLGARRPLLNAWQLALCLFCSSAMAPALAQEKAAVKVLEGAVEVQAPVEETDFTGLWKAKIIELGRKPKVLIESQQGGRVEGTYMGLLGKFPLTGEIDPSGRFRLAIDFSSMKLLKMFSKSSGLGIVEGSLEGGSISGTASLPDLSSRVVHFQARRDIPRAEANREF